MRKPRKNTHNRVYHLISRIAHRAFYLSADERDRFIDVMKRSAAFSGVRLLAWCVMTNHVHILVYVPEPEVLSDDALLSRMRTLYRKFRFDELKRQWDLLAAHPETRQFERFRASFLKRMWNAGEFMKTLKQHFTMSYNSRRVHAGTMWEGRYHVRVHKPDDFGMGGAAMLTAGYIDVNPLKAKIVSCVESVSDYRWGSYYEACGGDADAIRGYDAIYGGHGLGWERLKELHLHSMREAARELAAREAEDEGLSECSVSALVHERREARRLVRLEQGLPKQVPHVVDGGSDRVALNVLKALLRGPMRPIELRDMLGIASRSYFTLRYLSPLAKAGYVELVDGGNKSSCRSAYRLTRKGREFAKWH